MIDSAARTQRLYLSKSAYARPTLPADFEPLSMPNPPANLQVPPAYLDLVGRGRSYSSEPTRAEMLALKAGAASPTRKFLLGALAGAGTAAAACLAVAGTINPLGAVVMLVTAATGGVVARDGAKTDFSHYLDYVQRNEPLL